MPAAWGGRCSPRALTWAGGAARGRRRWGWGGPGTPASPAPACLLPLRARLAASPSSSPTSLPPPPLGAASSSPGAGDVGSRAQPWRAERGVLQNVSLNAWRPTPRPAAPRRSFLFSRATSPFSGGAHTPDTLELVPLAKCALRGMLQLRPRRRRVILSVCPTHSHPRWESGHAGHRVRVSGCRNYEGLGQGATFPWGFSEQPGALLRTSAQWHPLLLTLVHTRPGGPFMPCSQPSGPVRAGRCTWGSS